MYAPSRTVVVYAPADCCDAEADSKPTGIPGLGVKGLGACPSGLAAFFLFLTAVGTRLQQCTATYGAAAKELQQQSKLSDRWHDAVRRSVLLVLSGRSSCASGRHSMQPASGLGRILACWQQGISWNLQPGVHICIAAGTDFYPTAF